jgi:hypothetical protein
MHILKWHEINIIASPNCIYRITQSRCLWLILDEYKSILNIYIVDFIIFIKFIWNFCCRFWFHGLWLILFDYCYLFSWFARTQLTEQIKSMCTYVACCICLSARTAMQCTNAHTQTNKLKLVYFWLFSHSLENCKIARKVK